MGAMKRNLDKLASDLARTQEQLAMVALYALELRRKAWGRDPATPRGLTDEARGSVERWLDQVDAAEGPHAL